VPPVVEMPELRRKESRFFPLSAFIASSPDSAGREVPQETPPPLLPRKASAKEQSFSARATPAQKAATSAAYHALAPKLAESSSTCQRMMLAARDSSLPIASRSRPSLLQFAPRNSSTMTPPSPPLPITAPHTVSPTLSTSPDISRAPSSACSSSIPFTVPLTKPRRPPPPPPRATRSTRDTAAPWSISGVLRDVNSLDELSQGELCRNSPTLTQPTESCRPTSPLSLITAPVTSKCPFITLPKPSPTRNPLVKPSPVEGIKHDGPKHDEVTSVNPGAHCELQEFLRMGHAASCWCSPSPSQCRHSVSSNRTLLGEQLGILRRRMCAETGLAAGIDTIPTSPSSTSSHFDFEDLGPTGHDLMTPSDSEMEPTHNDAEEDWTVVMPETLHYNFPHPPHSHHDEPKLVSRPASLVLGSPPRTPVSTPRTPSPITHLSEPPFGTTELREGYPLMSPWSSPSWSP
jgi:hypothetical protein